MTTRDTDSSSESQNIFPHGEPPAAAQQPRNPLMERARLQRQVAATCGCGEAAQVISDLMQALEPPTPKEVHLMDLYDAIGVKWGDDPFTAIAALKAVAPAAALSPTTKGTNETIQAEVDSQCDGRISPRRAPASEKLPNEEGQPLRAGQDAGGVSGPCMGADEVARSTLSNVESAALSPSEEPKK